MKLKTLLKGISLQAVKGSKEIEITGLTAHSGSVAPGNLFIAKRGFENHGSRFIFDAVLAGASAVLTDLYDPFFPQITQLIHPDVAEIEALIAPRFYRDPCHGLLLVGITGTNGKTTTAYLVRHLFEQKKIATGLIGTIEQIVGPNVYPPGLTTPDLLQNYKLFHEMKLVSCRACVMEVSSIGLNLGRVRGLAFDVAVFTQLTQDHLDYHKTMDAYAAAKATLFTSLNPQATAVINADCPYSAQMIAGCKAAVLLYGIEQPCDLKASSLVLTAEGVAFDFSYRGETLRVVSPLIGRHNVYNLLAAAAVALTQGLTMQEIAASLKTFSTIPGRLERVFNTLGLNVFVDFAHTHDALCNVLKTLAELKPRRLITVFGCGGNRDKLKRPLMGAVVEALSDLCIVTSDNPRAEVPEEIIAEILGGMKDPRKAVVIVDRSEAIHRAIQEATPEDVVLIAGKGHENTQIFSTETIPFDDRLVAALACKQRRQFSDCRI